MHLQPVLALPRPRLSAIAVVARQDRTFSNTKFAAQLLQLVCVSLSDVEQPLAAGLVVALSFSVVANPSFPRTLARAFGSFQTAGGFLSPPEFRLPI
jgi:hypothetical protein